MDCVERQQSGSSIFICERSWLLDGLGTICWESGIYHRGSPFSRLSPLVFRSQAFLSKAKQWLIWLICPAWKLSKPQSHRRNVLLIPDSGNQNRAPIKTQKMGMVDPLSYTNGTMAITKTWMDAQWPQRQEHKFFKIRRWLGYFVSVESRWRLWQSKTAIHNFREIVQLFMIKRTD